MMDIGKGQEKPSRLDLEPEEANSIVESNAKESEEALGKIDSQESMGKVTK